MAVRKRFKPAEREAFVHNTEVEWLHGSRWRPGVIVGSIDVDSLGLLYVGVVNQGATRTISDGAYVRAHPGQVRLRGGQSAPGVSGCTDARATSTPKDVGTTEQQSELF